MKEQMEIMMNALKGRVSSDLDDLVNQTNSPFTASFNSFPLPHKFCMLQMDNYDGVKDPLDHLANFKTLIHLQGVVDKIMCRAFLTTLKGAAKIWFSWLTPPAPMKYEVNWGSLRTSLEREDKTLRFYITRFNKEVL